MQADVTFNAAFTKRNTQYRLLTLSEHDDELPNEGFHSCKFPTVTPYAAATSEHSVEVVPAVTLRSTGGSR